MLTRSAIRPTAMPESENSTKNALPTRPNWACVSCMSCIIGIATRPSTALSAKLISMNRNSEATMTQRRVRERSSGATEGGEAVRAAASFEPSASSIQYS
jgi:hypothetical protein